MSRGPGIWQRRILDLIADGGVVILTSPDHTHAQQNAIRRAAKALEAKGSLRLVATRVGGASRLAAYPLDVDTPEERMITGLDGKTYRLAV